MVVTRQRGKVKKLLPKQIEVLDYRGKADDTCHLVP